MIRHWECHQSPSLLPGSCKLCLSIVESIGLTIVLSKFSNRTTLGCSSTSGNSLWNVVLLKALTSALVSNFRVTFLSMEWKSFLMPNWKSRSCCGLECFMDSIWWLLTVTLFPSSSMPVICIFFVCCGFFGKFPAFLQQFL